MATNTDAEAFFQVHLQSLVDFAKELETQLDALERPADRLAVISETPLPLGDFEEAVTLRYVHLDTAAQMRELLRKVRDALAFAENVTLAVATGYKEFDEEVAASYRSTPVAVVTPGSVGTVPAGAVSTGPTPAGTVPAGTVQPIPVQSGPAQPAYLDADVVLPAAGTGTVYYSSAAAPTNLNQLQTGGVSDV